jgi:3-oxoacyl-[acyl-carrier-protein] synthase-3
MPSWQRVDTTDEWIVQRTGIRQRHVAADDEATSVLGLKAAQAALADAGMDASEIDLIIVATATPDTPFRRPRRRSRPRWASMAARLRSAGGLLRLRLRARDRRQVPDARAPPSAALVIGAETFSRILDWEDRTTCVLFGDGAGAVVLKAMPGEGTLADRGVLATHIRSDGRYKDKLYVDGGAGSTKTVGFLRMEGKEVFKHAVGNLA